MPEIRLQLWTIGVIGRPRRFWSYDRAIRGRGIACALAAGSLLIGCGNRDVEVPIECLEGPATVTKALARAPDEVRLAGGPRISDCFQQAATAADVQNLGGIFIEAAREGAERVRAAPRSHAAVELGYLLGAVRRGARTDTGVHYEVRRRVEQELVGIPISTPEFRRGLEAGRRGG